MRLHKVLAAATLVVAGSAQAQFQRPALTVAITPLQIRPDGAWRGSVGAGFSATAGNTKAFGANLSVDAVRATEQSKLSLYSQALYSENVKDGETVKTADQWRLGGRHDWVQPDGRTYYFGAGSVERDALRQLQFRSTAGAGVGYRLSIEPERSFEVFGGLGYRGDRYQPPGSFVDGELRRSYHAAELMLGEESAHRLSASTLWQQRLMVFPNLTNRGAYRAVFESVISVAMSRQLNLNVSLVDRYDNQAVAPVRKNDLLIFTGIHLKLGAL